MTQQPAAGGGVVFTGTDAGLVRAFDAAGCGEATCPALWETDAGGTTADDELAGFAPAA